MPITSNPRVIRLHENKFIFKQNTKTFGFHYAAKELLKMWLDVTNTAVCAENLKTRVLKCHNEIQLERSAQTSQTCVICHTVLLTVLAPQMGIPAAQYIASTGCSGDPVMLWQQ